MQNYIKKTLKSGREVDIRPLSWDEFWEFSLARTENIDANAKPIEIIKASRDARERLLSACVQDWANLRIVASLPEVLELEVLIDEISKAPIAEGNSLPVADTTATATN